MADFLLEKGLDGTFVLADDQAVKVYESMRLGELCKGQYKKTRNYENHKRYFSFINEAFDRQDHFENKKHFRQWLQLKAGHYDAVVSPKGKLMYLPRSISFEELDEIGFKGVFSDCITASLSIANFRDSDVSRMLDYV